MKTLTVLLFPLLLHASSRERAQNFFIDHYEAAEQLYFCHGIPIQLSLGVWALESKYGSSKAAQRNNLAGIASYKGGKHWKRFETKAEFYRAFAAIFQQPCYRNDLRPKTVEEYLRAMEWGCCSYHRSREYTHKIKWIIKRYKLDEMKGVKIDDIEQIDNVNNNLEITTFAGEKHTLEPKRIETRADAEKLAKKLTIEALVKDNAFHRLGTFKNNYRSMRNYEIEDYIHKLSDDPTYRIVEKCPYNKFSWFN